MTQELVIDWVDNFGTITGITNLGDYVFLDTNGVWRHVGDASARLDRFHCFLVIAKKRKHGQWKTGEPMPMSNEVSPSKEAAEGEGKA